MSFKKKRMSFKNKCRHCTAYSHQRTCLHHVPFAGENIHIIFAFNILDIDASNYKTLVNVRIRSDYSLLPPLMLND